MNGNDCVFFDPNFQFAHGARDAGALGLNGQPLTRAQARAFGAASAFLGDFARSPAFGVVFLFDVVNDGADQDIIVLVSAVTGEPMCASELAAMCQAAIASDRAERRAFIAARRAPRAPRWIFGGPQYRTDGALWVCGACTWYYAGTAASFTGQRATWSAKCDRCGSKFGPGGAEKIEIGDDFYV
jgi:hypothetical protein